MDDFKWNLEVDAPTFVNFFSLDDGKENAESYFERNGNLPTIKRENLTPSDKGAVEVAANNNKRSPLQNENAIIKNSDARHRNTEQSKDQRRHRRSSSVPAINPELLIVKQEPIAELSAQLDDCKITDKKSTTKLYKTSKCQSKDSLYGSSSTINSQRSVTSKLNGFIKNNKFMSTAELVRKFEKETPKRFHTVSSKADAKALLQDLANKINNDKVLPKTPKLLTKNRNRPVTAVGFEMREEMEFQLMKKHKMKARPVNKDLLQKRTTGPCVQRRPTTKPEPFKLTEVSRKPITQITENFVFTAKPVPRHVIEGQGLKSKVPKKLPTVPVTPKVMKYKSKQPEVLETLKKEREEHSKSILPRRTVLQPFSFESRYKDAERKKEQKLNQILEEQNRLREFQSKPMPVFKTPVKAKAPHNPVIAKSPKFASKELMIEKQQRFKMKMEEEERAKQQAAEFKAKPCLVIYKRPFQPEIVDKVIEMDDFQLHSEIRAKQRQEFDAKMKLKEEKKMEEHKQKEQQLKEDEAKLNTELRKKTIHKAQPIKKFKPVNSFDSKEPTVPESPMFASKHRTQIQKNE